MAPCTNGRLQLVAVLLTTAAAGSHDSGTLFEDALEQLIPRAAGVALVHIDAVNDAGVQDGCGPWIIQVEFTPLAATGYAPNVIPIVKYPGGNRPWFLSGPPYAEQEPWQPPGPVYPWTFCAGEAYWVAFGSKYDWRSSPQQIVATWPEDEAPALLAEAVRRDHYKHQPQYHPESGLTYGFIDQPDANACVVRMERDGRLLWERTLPGYKSSVEHHRGVWRLSRQPPPPIHPTKDIWNLEWYFITNTTATFPSPIKCLQLLTERRVTSIFDAKTGRPVAVSIAKPGTRPDQQTAWIRYFDPATGRLLKERAVL